MTGMRTRDLVSASRLRQELRQAWERMGALLEPIHERGLLIRGSLYARKRRGGRPGCRGERGELHVSEAFSVSEDGQTRHVPLSQVDRERLQEGVTNYRKFRIARQELRATCEQVLTLVDEMERLRCVAWEELECRPD